MRRVEMVEGKRGVGGLKYERCVSWQGHGDGRSRVRWAETTDEVARIAWMRQSVTDGARVEDGYSVIGMMCVLGMSILDANKCKWKLEGWSKERRLQRGRWKRMGVVRSGCACADGDQECGSVGDRTGWGGACTRQGMETRYREG